MTQIKLTGLTEDAFYFNGPILDVANDANNVDRRIYVRFDHIELVDLDWLGSSITLFIRGGHVLSLAFDTTEDEDWEVGMPMVRINEQITAAIKAAVAPPTQETT